MSSDNDRPLDRVGKALRDRENRLRMSSELNERSAQIEQLAAWRPGASVFERHRDILLDADYSAAQSLQQFVLSLYNSASAKFEADRLGNYDDRHFRIFSEMAASYRLNGENDPEFMRVCQDMWSQRKGWGRESLAQLEAHRAISPTAYPDGTERDWREQLEWLERRVQALRAKGWIDE